MNRRRTTTRRAAALALITLAACGRNDEPARTAQAGGPGMGGPGGERIVTVQVQTVARGSIARQVTVSGTVEPLRVIGVNSQLAGALNSVNVQEGDYVSEGAVLARINDREIRAQLAAAEASLDVAEAAFRRAEQLRERKVITLPEYERDRTAFVAAQSQVDMLRARAGYATVNAPVAGVITQKHVETGDIIGNQTPLFTIADVSQLVVRAGVSELDVVELEQGDLVSITLDALPDRQLNGRIRRIFPVGDPTTRLVPVEVVLDAQSARVVRPGFLARVTFDLATSDNVLLIPVAAVLGGRGSQAVFVVENSTAIRRTVGTGLTSQGHIEILSGLDEGEEVVVLGQHELRDGMTVRSVGGATEVPATQSSATAPAAVDAPAGDPAVKPAAAMTAPR